jgi:hypothetical protein
VCRASRCGAVARPPEARSGSQTGWDDGVIAVLRRGCAPRSANSVGWSVEPALDQWRRASNRSEIDQIADSPRAFPENWALSRRRLAMRAGRVAPSSVVPSMICSSVATEQEIQPVAARLIDLVA